MRNAVCSQLQREFRLTFTKNWTRHRRAQQIGMFIDCASAQRRPDVIANKFLAQIFDVSRRSPGSQRFLAGGFEIFLLADVANHGDHFATVIFLEPGNNDRGIEASRIGKHNFFRLGCRRFHSWSFSFYEFRM